MPLEWPSRASSQVVLYTALFGGNGDQLRPLPRLACKAICFTDQLPAGPRHGWEVRRVQLPGVAQRRAARYHKALPHQVLPPETEVSIWIDAAYQLRCEPGEILRDARNPISPLATFQHPQRRTWYEEAQACIQYRKDDVGTLQRQIQRYLNQQLPPGWHFLAETGIVVRLHRDPRIRALGELWWQELRQGSCRDQVSLPYCCWKLGLAFQALPGSGHKNRYARHHPHQRT